MPELPDIVLYCEALSARTVGHPLEKIRLASPFLLRSVEPSIFEAEGKKVVALRRMGKRVVFELEGKLFLVFHLMIAGRFHWKDERRAKVPGKIGLAALDFPTGTLLVTEASSRKRASLHAVLGEAGLEPFRRGGLEVLEASLDEFRERLALENHTLKRSLTDPRLFSGIGNAYSDEILHAARLSPVKLTSRLTADEVARLHETTRAVLERWTKKLGEELAGAFPEKVTAFRPDFAVHGKYKQPCPDCGSPVQRIVHAENETNYCARCQNAGKLLADRSLSRLLKGDWPKTLDELEELRPVARPSSPPEERSRAKAPPEKKAAARKTAPKKPRTRER